MFERVRSMVASVRERIRVWQAWEVEEVEYDYKRVVQQASGNVVHIRACKQMVNSVSGEERMRYEDVDTVWTDVDWPLGGPVRWDGEYVYPDSDAMVFGNVARGYQR